MVDDSLETRYLYGMVFQRLVVGCEVAEAPDKERALAALRRQRFDLVITDMWMPGGTGLELVAAMRAEAALASIPVLMITGMDRVDAMRLDDSVRWLIKPVVPRELARVVQEMLGFPPVVSMTSP